MTSFSEVKAIEVTISLWKHGHFGVISQIQTFILDLEVFWLEEKQMCL